MPCNVRTGHAALLISERPHAQRIMCPTHADLLMLLQMESGLAHKTACVYGTPMSHQQA